MVSNKQNLNISQNFLEWLENKYVEAYWLI